MQLDDDPRDDLRELELDTETPTEAEIDVERDRRGLNWPLIWTGIILVAAIIGVYFGFFRGRQQAIETVAAPAPSEPAPAEPAPAPLDDRLDLDLPELDASDELIRELVGQLSEHPKLASWLASDELVRRFAVAVDNVAEGKSPRQHLRFLEPSEGFTTAYRDGVAIVDPESYRRYDAPAELFASLDAAEVAKLYRAIEPLVAEAYRDLGYPDRDFGTVLARAIGELVSTPVPSASVPLLPKVSSFEFADPSLEELSPAQKHLLRMGPENARRIQRKLVEIRDELGLEP